MLHIAHLGAGAFPALCIACPAVATTAVLGAARLGQAHVKARRVVAVDENAQEPCPRAVQHILAVAGLVEVDAAREVGSV